MPGIIISEIMTFEKFPFQMMLYIAKFTLLWNHDFRNDDIDKIVISYSDLRPKSNLDGIMISEINDFDKIVLFKF